MSALEMESLHKWQHNDQADQERIIFNPMETCVVRWPSVVMP